MYTTSPEIFVYYTLPVIVVAVGLTGNIFGMTVFIRNNKKLEKIGPLFMYRLMFGYDAMFLMGIFVMFFGKGFQLSLYLVSDLSCKLYYYFSYASGSYSTLILIYISLDRFISIKYYAKRLLLKNSKYQYIYFLSFVVSNYVYNVPAFFYYKLFKNSQNKTECNLYGENSVIVPCMTCFLLVIAFSVLFTLTFLLIHTIFSSRNRVDANFTRRENRYFYKDLRLAFTSVLFNVFIFLLYLPGAVTITFFSQINDLIYTSVFYVFFFGSCLNFYILFLSNSVFRSEVISYFIKPMSAEPVTHRDQAHRVYFINQRNQETVTFNNIRGHNNNQPRPAVRPERTRT